jgi:photosystem II stability/assembly factor-like uncharacterized protein
MLAGKSLKRFYQLVLFVALPGMLVYAAEGPGEEFSEIAPLASRSLLLDVTSTGSRLVAVGERGHVLLSDDNGHSWQQVVVPTRSQLTSVYFADARHGWAGGHDGVILHTQDAGNSWSLQHRDNQYDDPVLDIWFRNSEQGFAVGAYGMFLSTTNGGKSWERRHIVDDDFHFNAITATPGGNLFIVAEQGHIYRSSDGGYTWEELPSPYAGSFFGITVLGENDLLIYGLRGRLYRSLNGGMDWQRLETATEASLMSALKMRNGDINIAGLGGNILTSRDNGMRFTAQVRENRKALTGIAEAEDGAIIITGEAGVGRYSRSRQ